MYSKARDGHTITHRYIMHMIIACFYVSTSSVLLDKTVVEKLYAIPIQVLVYLA